MDSVVHLKLINKLYRSGLALKRKGTKMRAHEELTKLAAEAIGLSTSTEDGMYDDLKWFEPLNDDIHTEMLIEKLKLVVEYPKYKGYGTTCGKHTVFRDNLAEQNRLAVVLEAADKASMY